MKQKKKIIMKVNYDNILLIFHEKKFTLYLPDVWNYSSLKFLIIYSL